jgi:hypothetical protein
MYFSAQHIDVKLNQDRSGSSKNDDIQKLVICDGIGEFKDSDLVAELTVNNFIESDNLDFLKLMEILKSSTSPETEGGTTFISANHCEKNIIKLEYLGNGGIIHLHGDYGMNPNTEVPYRYNDLMHPHISPSGKLTKHISLNSGENELRSTKIEVNLDYDSGDIVLLFSDGISSLEDKFILKDAEARFWRYENSSIQRILKDLDLFLKENSRSIDFRNRLVQFNKNVLKDLKNENYLEDDASLGIILTDKVLKLYSGLND